MVRKSWYTCRTEFDVTRLSILGRVEGAVVSLRTDLVDRHVIRVKGLGKTSHIAPKSIKPIDTVRIEDQRKWTAVKREDVDAIEGAVETDNVRDDALFKQDHVAWNHKKRPERQVIRKR